MKRLILVTLYLIGALLLSSPELTAQTAPSAQASNAPSKDNQGSIDQTVALLRQDLRSRRKQAISIGLQLTDSEATKFWPLYDQYNTELTKLGDERYALIKEYASGFGTLTDNQALDLIKRSLAMDEQVAQLRSKYVPIMNRALPGRKTATFFQLDRYIYRLIDLQLASEIPTVQEQQ